MAVAKLGHGKKEIATQGCSEGSLSGQQGSTADQSTRGQKAAQSNRSFSEGHAEIKIALTSGKSWLSLITRQKNSRPQVF